MKSVWDINPECFQRLWKRHKEFRCLRYLLGKVPMTERKGNNGGESLQAVIKVWHPWRRGERMEGCVRSVHAAAEWWENSPRPVGSPWAKVLDSKSPDGQEWASLVSLQYHYINWKQSVMGSRALDKYRDGSKGQQRGPLVNSSPHSRQVAHFAQMSSFGSPAPLTKGPCAW